VSRAGSNARTCLGVFVVDCCPRVAGGSGRLRYKTCQDEKVDFRTDVVRDSLNTAAGEVRCVEEIGQVDGVMFA